MRKSYIIQAVALASCLAVAGSTAWGSEAEPSGSPAPDAASDIVYQGDEGRGNEVFLMSSDGSGSRAIMRDLTGTKVHPDWSPDGSRIAFELEEPEHWDIWTAAADGSDAAPLVDRAPCPEGECMGVSYPAWSPDGRSIAYARFYKLPVDVWRSDLEVIDMESGETRVIASAPLGTVYEHPRWTPDGASLVYTYTSFSEELDAHTRGGLAIVSTVTPGAEPRELTDPAMFASYPDVRASDGRIVFNTYDLAEFKDPAPASNLYTMRADGSDLTQLTDYGPGETRAGQPTWTPDGQRILFTLGGSRTPRAAFIDADGDGLTILFPALATHPRLRPGDTRD